MVDFNAFVTKGGEFYDTWPGFFTWAAPATAAIVGGLCGLTWWLRGHGIEAERAALKEQINTLKEQNNTLKEQNNTLKERLTGAKEQADRFKLEMEELQSKMEELQSAVTTVKDQAEQGATSKDLTVSSAKANAIADSAALVLRVLIRTFT